MTIDTNLQRPPQQPATSPAPLPAFHLPPCPPLPPRRARRQPRRALARSAIMPKPCTYSTVRTSMTTDLIRAATATAAVSPPCAAPPTPLVERAEALTSAAAEPSPARGRCAVEEWRAVSERAGCAATAPGAEPQRGPPVSCSSKRSRLGIVHTHTASSPPCRSRT